MTSQFVRPGSLALAAFVAGGAVLAHSAAPALAADALSADRYRHHVA